MLNSLKHKGKISLAVIAGLLSGAFFPPDSRKPEDFSELVNAVKSKYEYKINELGLEGACRNRETARIQTDYLQTLVDYIQSDDGNIFVIPVESNTDNRAPSYIAGNLVGELKGYNIEIMLYEQIAPTFDQYCRNTPETNKAWRIRGKGWINVSEVERESYNIFNRAGEINPLTEDIEDRFILNIAKTYGSPEEFKKAYIRSMAAHEGGHTDLPKGSTVQEQTDDEIRALLHELSTSTTPQTLIWMYRASLAGRDVPKKASEYVLNELIKGFQEERHGFGMLNLADAEVGDIQRIAGKIEYK